MDKLKKARGNLRRTVTKSVNDIEAELAKQAPDHDLLEARLKQLEKVMSDLLPINQKITDLMLDGDANEDELEVETTANGEYDLKVELVTVKVDKVLNPRSRPGTVVSSVVGSEAGSANNDIETSRTFKLPKIELKKFDGELTEWLGFWAQFEKIHEDTKLHASDKFQYLTQSMQKGTRARELVESYPQTADNYPKVVAALKQRFGKSELLVEVYARDLHRLVLQNANSREKVGLSALYDKLESRLRALESLCTTAETNAVLLYTLVESCLPEGVLRAWNRSALSSADGTTEDPPKSRLDYLLEFLQKEIESEERIALARAAGERKDKGKEKGNSDSFKSKSNRGSTEDFSTAAGLHVGGGASKCVFCDKNHDSKECGRAHDMNIDEKIAALKKRNCCFTCLRMGHRSLVCKSFVRCAVCSGKHATIMCPQLPGNKKATREEKVHTTSGVKITQSNLSCSSGVMLKTLMVTIVTPKEQARKVRVLIDDGSQRSYIRRQLAEELGLEFTGKESIIHSLFGGIKTVVQHHKRYLLKMKNTNKNGLTEIQALDQEEICGEISRLKAGPWMQELKAKKIWLSDIGSEQVKIDILIGADKCGRILTGRTLQLQNGLTAVETVLGWTVMGEFRKEAHQGVLERSNTVAMTVTNLLVSNFSVEQLWSLEAIGIHDPVETKSREESELATKKHFIETVSRNEDGRYTVSLPWVNEKQEIPDNKTVALRRLDFTTKKLTAEGKFGLYDETLKAWLKDGIIEEVPDNEVDRRAHYLPHRAVFKEESLTTPVRPVFDASCKTGRAPSLNDCLEKGPNLLEQIPSILHRFREGKIGVTSDVRKAFLMIEVNAEDRDFLRFLWWEDHERKTMKIFRHKRVVFGVNCSPFLLGAVIEFHLKNVDPDKRKSAAKLLNSLYVDNCVTSVDTYQDYLVFKVEATDMMKTAGMELRMWQSSAAETSGVGPLISRACGSEAGKEETVAANQLTSVLGLKWDMMSDTLCCDMSFVQPLERLTKKSMLSTVHKIFDPLGFLCPVLLFPKKLLQETFAAKLGWEAELGDEMASRFMGWFRELHLLNRITIPRNSTGGAIDRRSWQLHTFCDASKDAYAAVVFLRTEEEGVVSTQLLQAKSRVAPRKKPSIPRLELLACTIGSRLAISVKKSLSLENVPEYYWSDSTTALAWIKRNDDWGTFVGNRVREICQLTNPENWKHIAGILNPADLPSRGCSASQLCKSCWWIGPDWLKNNPRDWPSEPVEVNEEEVIGERKKKLVVGLVTTTNQSPWYVNLTSSFQKLIRICAWGKRIWDNCESSLSDIQEKELSVFETEAAERRIIKVMQEEVFDQRSETFSGICVTRDEEGIIRVKTKLFNRDDTFGFRFPILLPHSHPLVELIVRDYHLRYGHSGIQFLMGQIREKYWIVKSRIAISRILSECVICRRFSAKKPNVAPAQLPEDRVRNAKAFEVTGVDLAGPLFLKNKDKVWIVLFTCAVYRCVHLELVRSLSSEDFLDAFSRFTDRRGRPITVYSDNGTNFVGAVNLFKGIDWIKVARESTMKRIQWKFNPPSAAWWGGWWERLVRTVKDMLKRILGKSKVDFDKLSTYLCNIEAYINGRPLTTVTEDINDLSPLTPAMFLHELPSQGVSEFDFLNAREFQGNIKVRKTLLEEFKTRFRREYLSQLVQRGKERKARRFVVGEVVLVGDDNKKRWQWPLAKVMELIPGKDGNVRIARIKTAQGILIRPIQRLFPLEVSPATGLQKKVVEKAAKEKPRETGREQAEKPRVNITKSGRQVKAPERYIP